MTDLAFVTRQMTPADGVALTELALSSPDTGLIQIAPRYHMDAYQATITLHPDTIGYVAEDAATGKVVGSGFLGIDRLYYEGQLRDCAWLHNLQVHPDYRRRGIATQLANCRVEYARTRVGEGGVIVASIQQGNEGSFAVAHTWCEQIRGETKNGAVSMRRKPPKLLPGVNIRQPEPHELSNIASGLNEFYEDWNFYQPHTGEILTEWLVNTPFSNPFRHYFIAEDNAGNLIAGMAIVEEFRIVEMQVEHLPMTLQLLNKIVKLVPQDGTMRQLSVTKAWFAPGHLQTAKYLLEFIRWEWRKQGSTLTFSYDPRGPLKDVFRTPLWIPQTSFTYAVSGPEPMSDDRLIYSN